MGSTLSYFRGVEEKKDEETIKTEVDSNLYSAECDDSKNLTDESIKSITEDEDSFIEESHSLISESDLEYDSDHLADINEGYNTKEQSKECEINNTLINYNFPNKRKKEDESSVELKDFQSLDNICEKNEQEIKTHLRANVVVNVWEWMGMNSRKRKRNYMMR